MKFVSTMALGAALALGVAAGVATAPAAAQEQKAPSYKLSKEVREPVAAAQKALQAGDNATALAQLNQARPLAKTPDEQFVVGSTLLDVAQKNNDNALRAQAIDLVLASGRAPAERVGTFYLVGGQLAYNARDYAKADQLLTKASQTPGVDPAAFALLAETKVQEKQPDQALAALQQGISKMKASGQAVPNDWFARGIGIAYSNKLAQPAEQITYDWLTAYPTASNWRDALIIYRDLNKPDPDTALDLMRLSRAAKAMKGQADYLEYAQAIYLKYPGEAKAVLDEGIAAGYLKLEKTGTTAEINSSVTARLAGDKASLDKSAATAKSAAGTGRQALTTADGYLGYGMWDKAIDLYNVALQKGGVDANLVNTRLGIAQARAGQAEAAKATFAKVTGPRAALAHYWSIFVDKGSQG